MARHIFFSFHYKPDAWRASTVRSIGSIEGNKPANDNDWETVISQSDSAIKNWIASQMQGRSCTIVLVGSDTANRKWINHEIVQSWNNGMGVVGIRIHGLKNSLGFVSKSGANPFDYITYGDNGKKLSSIVKCYNPPGADSKQRYDWIKNNIAAAADEAVEIRRNN